MQLELPFPKSLQDVVNNSDGTLAELRTQIQQAAFNPKAQDLGYLVTEMVDYLRTAPEAAVLVAQDRAYNTVTTTRDATFKVWKDAVLKDIFYILLEKRIEGEENRALWQRFYTALAGRTPNEDKYDGVSRPLWLWETPVAYIAEHTQELPYEDRTRQEKELLKKSPEFSPPRIRKDDGNGFFERFIDSFVRREQPQKQWYTAVKLAYGQLERERSFLPSNGVYTPRLHLPMQLLWGDPIHVLNNILGIAKPK